MAQRCDGMPVGDEPAAYLQLLFRGLPLPTWLRLVWGMMRAEDVVELHLLGGPP